MTSRFLLLWAFLGVVPAAAARADGLYARAAWVSDIPLGLHQVEGTATIIDDRTIHVEHFTYDGMAPAVYFYLGESDTYNAFLNGLQLDPLLDRAYNDESLTLTLPPGETLDGYGAISVWCADVDVNFSSAAFVSPGAAYSRAGWVAEIPPGAHQVEGTVTIINERIFHVENFTYDGTAPLVYFYLGAFDDHFAFLHGLEVPPTLGAYAGASLVVTLPDGETLDNYLAISVWCAVFNINFSSATFKLAAAADYDDDGDVDLDDHEVFTDCLAGPGALPAPASVTVQECLDAFDVDEDMDVDLFDYADFLKVFTGPPPETAQYEVVFDATWSAETHPTDFPSNAHFSGLIGGTHDANVVFWQPGQLASPGIETMAELGSKTLLTAEVEAAIGLGYAGEVIDGGGINPSPGSVATTFAATQTFPRATVVSMIAPSPDWFVGVSGFELFQDNQWVQEFAYSLQPYDAGTDSGTTYTSPNMDTNPQDPISEIAGYPFNVGLEIPPLGTFTFRKTD